MGSAAMEMLLDLNLGGPSSVGGFLKDEVALETGDGRLAKLEESVKSLEEEKRKIEAFKRELPLCMLLLTDVIEGLKNELEQCRGERFSPAFEEFIRSKSEDEDGVKMEADCNDKINWMSSAQLWSDNSSEEKNGDDMNIKERNGRPDQRTEKQNFFLESKSQSSGSAFVPFKGGSAPIMNSKEEVKPTVALPDLSLVSPAVKSVFCAASAAAKDHPGSASGSNGVGSALASTPVIRGLHKVQQQHQVRKARRCWSSELHRRFVLALQQLGGAQVATPKQIRDVMKVDGLTNDEVKSHLQKYRLHTRKMPNSSAAGDRPVVVLGGLWVPPENYTASPQLSLSHSGSPQSPLHLTGSNQAISGESCEEEDGKSESYNWRS